MIFSMFTKIRVAMNARVLQRGQQNTLYTIATGGVQMRHSVLVARVTPRTHQPSTEALYEKKVSLIMSSVEKSASFLKLPRPKSCAHHTSFVSPVTSPVNTLGVRGQPVLQGTVGRMPASALNAWSGFTQVGFSTHRCHRPAETRVLHFPRRGLR